MGEITSNRSFKPIYEEEKMRGFFLAVLAVVMVFGISVRAHAVADFSGTWALDGSKSDLGTPAAKTQMKVVLVIKQTENTLSIQRATGDVALYKLDGSESLNTLPNGGQSKTVMTWSGDTLVGKTVSTINGSEMKMADKRSLSAGGREMVLELSMHMPSGERKQRLVYAKQ